jgi:hypothetical protein
MENMQRSFISRYYELVLDGDEPAGFVASVDYGGFKGELIAQPMGGHPYKEKHVYNPALGPITVKCGIGMSKTFFTWIQDSWSGSISRKNGSIITYDANLSPIYEFEFHEALILETTIPTLDASSKDPFYITVKFQPERGKNKPNLSGRHRMLRLPHRQKLFLPSNFSVDIDGLDVQRVSKIEQFVVKQNVKPLTVGADWVYQNEPTSLEYPNLTFTFSMANATPWFDWHQEFIIDGTNGRAKEKTGSITVLAQDLQKELFEVDLRGLGVVDVMTERSDNSAAQDTIRRVKAEVYCEEMSFKFLDS